MPQMSNIIHSKSRVFQASGAPAALCVQAPKQIQRYIGNMLQMITHKIVSFHIASVWRNADFFCEKSQMTLSLNPQHNGTVINLPVSLIQQTFTRAV
jgi:hypothetical protein